MAMTRPDDNRLSQWARRISGREGGFAVPLTRMKSASSGVPFLLGADKIPLEEAFSEIVSLESVDGQFLFRILREKDGKNVQAFLVHASPELYQYAFFSVEGMAGEFLTDAHGRARLDNIALDAAKANVTISPASAVFKFSLKPRERLEGLNPSFEKDAAHPWRIDVSRMGEPEAEVLEVRAAAAGGSAPRHIVLITEERKALISVPVKGTSLFDRPGPGREFQINIYA